MTGEPRRRSRAIGIAIEVADLLVPALCGGCDNPGSPWCEACTALTTEPGPSRISPRSDPGVPVWVAAVYAGPLRRAIPRWKDRGRGDLIGPLALLLARALGEAVEAGDVLHPRMTQIVLVPVPSRGLSRRRRGVDHAAALAGACARICPPGVVTALLLRQSWGVRDSVGLGAAARQRNIHGRIRLRRAPRGSINFAGRQSVVLVDDVVTTGASAAECVRVLRAAGLPVAAVVAVAATP